MTEIDRIISLFEKLYNGEPWIDVNFKSTLKNIAEKQAASKPFPDCNSIWEIVNHLIEWKINVLQKLKGSVIKTPDNNYFEPIQVKTNKAWANTLNKYEYVQNQWLDFLKQFDVKLLEMKSLTNKMTYYEYIQGILQHDAYHLGQIIFIVKNFSL